MRRIAKPILWPLIALVVVVSALLTSTATAYAIAVTLPNDGSPVSNTSNGVIQPLLDAAVSAANGPTNSGMTFAGIGIKVGDKPGEYGGLGYVAAGLSGFFTGIDTQVSVAQAPGMAPVLTRVYYPGAIGTTLNMTSVALSNPPVSTREYVADLMQNMKHPFAPSAYAQGIGFSSLSPVLALWKVFRNISYFFFVLIFVFVGFLIMIRSKIGSQAAVTVQQALPKLVVSLILVTFSYAIAGLMIDAMYLIIYILIGIFSAAGTGGLTTADLTKIAFTNNFFTNGIDIIGNLTGQLAGAIGSLVNNLTSNVFGSGSVGAAIGQVSGGLTNVVATLVIAVAILVSLFRVFFALVQAYIGVFFSVIFAPIQLLIGALPGQNTFGTWIKGLIENLLVFPTVILLIFVAYYFTKSPAVSFNGNNTGFTAPQLGSNQQGGFPAFQAIIALGAVLAMPEAMKLAKGLMSGKLGVGVDDLRKNWSKGVVPGKTILGVGGGLAAGFGIGGTVGAINAARGGGTWKDKAAKFGQGLAIGGTIGGLGGGAVASGTATKLVVGFGKQIGAAGVNTLAGDTIKDKINNFKSNTQGKGGGGTPPSIKGTGPGL